MRGSRRIEKANYTDLASRYLATLGQLFLQSLRLF